MIRVCGSSSAKFFGLVSLLHSGIKLQFNRNKHGLTTLHYPWSTITKYGHYGNSYMNSTSNMTMSDHLYSTGTIIFDFSRYMVITSFEWYLYHYYPGSRPRIKLYYWDDETNKWIIIFNGVSEGNKYNYDSGKYILHFRKNGINFSSGMLNNGSSGPQDALDPPIKLHYAKEDNLGDYVTEFVRQKKWACRFKVQILKGGQNPSQWMRSMRMKGTIHPTAQHAWPKPSFSTPSLYEFKGHCFRTDTIGPYGPGLATLRKLYGLSIDKNSVHGSDSLENAKKEINFFFKK